MCICMFATFVIANMELDRLDKAQISLQPCTDVDLAKYQPCLNSKALLAKYHPLILNDYIPISVYGNGNCLFRSVSLCLYGSEEHHEELGARAALEIAMHHPLYDHKHPDYCALFKNDIVSPADLCISVVVSGHYADDSMCILALSSVVGQRIQMSRGLGKTCCYPLLDGPAVK